MPAELLERAENDLLLDIRQRFACKALHCRERRFAILQPRVDRLSTNHARRCFEYDGTLDNVLKLAHIPRPSVTLEHSDRFMFDMTERVLIPLRNQMKEVLCKFGNVFVAMPQRGQFDRQNI